jgi:uncharacterized delta-60 repeat protein
VCVAFTLLISVAPAYPQAGAFDFTFNSSGYRYDGFSGGFDDLRAIALQPDGKIVAAGRTDNVVGSGTDFALVRYNADGSLDTTFGGGDGKVTTAVGPGSNQDIAYAVAIQPDGKIVAAGSSQLSATGIDFALVRYNADGSLDTTFDEDGRVTTSIGPTTNQDAAHAVALQADGRIIAAGFAGGFATGVDLAVARFNLDGSLDTTFDVDGKATTALGPSTATDIANAIAVQSDGKIVAAGFANAIAGSGTDFALVRYNADGTLDAAFDGDGRVTTAVGPATSSDLAQAILIQSDGKIVAGGQAAGSGTDFGLVRYTSSGALDATFDTDGRVTTAIGPTTNVDVAYALAMQPDGKIVAAGYANGIGSTGADFVVVRYNINGSLDSSFDTDGKASTTIATSAGADVAYAVAIQPDGKIVAAGAGGGIAGTGSDFALVRFTSSGALDTTFDSDGKVTTDIGNATSKSTAVAVQADGKMVSAGYVQNPSTGLDFAVIRYNVDGSLDTTFDGDGKATTSFSVGSDAANAVAIQADGKIMAAGYAPGGSSSPDFALVRYNTDGSLDTTFDGDGKVITDVGTAFGNDVAYAISIQADGKIVVAGHASTGTWWDMAVVRYNADGSLDTSFDGDGRAIVDIGSNNDIAYAVVVQTDGKIVAAGVASGFATSGADFGVVRLNTDGSLDTSFDTDGRVTTAIGPGTGFDEARGVTIQTDGKIVAAGSANNGFSTGTDFALVRYNTNGSLDSTFDTDGIVTTAIGPATANDGSFSVISQSDGKIVAGGYTQSSGVLDFALSRYNSDGSLDTTFSGDGIATIDLGANEYVFAMALYENYRVVIAGFGPNNFLTARVWLNVFATAAKVDLSGQVVDTRGRAVSGVALTLTDAEGASRTATTNTFGYYRFQKVEAGRSYVLHATSKKYAVEDPVRLIEVIDEVSDIDFVAEPIGPGRGKPSNPKPIKPTSKSK